MGWEYSGHQFADTERYMGIFHEVAPASQALNYSTCHDQDRLDWAALGYTPHTKRAGRPLCESCHGLKDEQYTFYKLHEKHVHKKGIGCINCHIFTNA